MEVLRAQRELAGQPFDESGMNHLRDSRSAVQTYRSPPRSLLAFHGCHQTTVPTPALNPVGKKTKHDLQAEINLFFFVCFLEGVELNWGLNI